MAWITSLALPSEAHTACLLGSKWFHCHCYSCWPSHGIAISINWRLLLQLNCTFTNSLSQSFPCGTKTSISLHEPFSPGPSIATEASSSPMVSLGLLQCQSSVAFHDPSSFQNKYHLGDSYTLPIWLPARGTTLATSGRQLLCAQGKYFPEDFTGDAGLFLITANFLAPTDQNQVSQ